jgi:hypothetical protein
MIENKHFHSSTVSQYSATRTTHTLTKPMKAPQERRVVGPTTGCWTNEDTFVEEKQRVGQTVVRYTQKEKHIYIYIITDAQVSMLVSMIV